MRKGDEETEEGIKWNQWERQVKEKKEEDENWKEALGFWFVFQWKKKGKGREEKGRALNVGE